MIKGETWWFQTEKWKNINGIHDNRNRDLQMDDHWSSKQKIKRWKQEF